MHITLNPFKQCLQSPENLHDVASSKSTGNVKDDFRAGIETLMKFITTNAAHDAKGLRGELHQFLEQVQDGRPQVFSAKDLELIYGSGKEALDTLCTMLQDDSVSLRARCACVEHLARGLSQMPARMAEAHLQHAVQILSDCIEASAAAEAKPAKSDRTTALMFAAKSGNVDAVRVLSKAPGEIDKTTKHDRHTALTLAVESGHYEVVEALCAAGATKSHATKDGRTALSIAESKNRPDLARLLKLANTSDFRAMPGYAEAADREARVARRDARLN